jgi:hypothetical protein
VGRVNRPAHRVHRTGVRPLTAPGRCRHSSPGREGGAAGSVGVCLEARRLADADRAPAGPPASG